MINSTNFLFRLHVGNILAQHDVLDPDEKCFKVSQTAKFAWKHYPGVLSDPDLENTLLEIASGLPFPDHTKDQTRILHIATTLYSTGGHTRIILNWVRQDADHKGYLVVTDQVAPLNDLTRTGLDETCEVVHFLDMDHSPTEKATEVRNFIAENNIGLVVLHHHPHDVVPLLALGHDNAPPVMTFNHADQAFWLGISITDRVLNFKSSDDERTVNQRGAHASQVIDFPLGNSIEVDKDQARNHLNIAPGTKVLLTIAHPDKYKPWNKFSFLTWWTDYLRGNPGLVMFVIGVNREQYIRMSGYSEPPENMVLTGFVEDPVVYFKACDFFLDPYPISTGLGTYEAIHFGAFPIFGFGDLPMLCPDGIAENFPEMNKARPETPAEYHDRVNSLLNSSGTNESGDLKESMDRCYNPRWNQRIQNICSEVVAEGHRINKLSARTLDLSMESIRHNQMNVRSMQDLVYKTLANIERIPERSDRKRLLNLMFRLKLKSPGIRGFRSYFRIARRG